MPNGQTLFHCKTQTKMRLKEILAERKRAKAQAETSQATKEQEVEENSTPALILVPAFDLPNEDRFSQYF